MPSDIQLVTQYVKIAEVGGSQVERLLILQQQPGTSHTLTQWCSHLQLQSHQVTHSQAAVAAATLD